MPSNRLHVLRLNARELLRQPGLARQIAIELSATDLGVDDDRVAGAVDVELEAVSSIEGCWLIGAHQRLRAIAR